MSAHSLRRVPGRRTIGLNGQDEKPVHERMKLFMPHRISFNVKQEKVGEQPVLIGGQLQIKLGLVFEGRSHFPTVRHGPIFRASCHSQVTCLSLS
ncbi:hypothetical protein [Deinococcus humi]|uniref:Uncharacterized protein n=1 Tax=Deinococcus humi TaxID=662880 RepID=A0A7W8JT69_9DEIO|nr:hypothetical protein [Deinococcus humi]MBB5362797.1 hypothetical protein [Deinococcus humi]GGO26212.1 hypothetical protein GCM10008949_16820 [Deinococcus humi]